MRWEIREGDALERLREMPAASVQCCVTSPPYFGLRDYGIDGQIGLEPAPDEFVARLVEVFREVRRVLRDDGTLWLNLGDSYASSVVGVNKNGQGASTIGYRADGSYSLGSDGSPYLNTLSASQQEGRKVAHGCKPKDLLGVPWLVAFALRQPYYAGRIKDERDRIWLAAMIDAEGCIYIHRRPEGMSNGQGYVRKSDSFGSGLEVANTSERVVQRCLEIAGRGSISRQDKDRRQPLYRWCLRTNECRDVLREVYPYLVAKQHEARLAIGVPSSGGRATAAWESLKLLHGGGLTDVDFPAPASLHEPGFYLRSDVIWSKLNPMPERVTDRPTSAHEHVFLLAKNARYFYDADAIREDGTGVSWNAAKSTLAANGVKNIILNQTGQRRTAGPSSHHDDVERTGRNKRNVWEMATQPCPDAHFATFPPKLVEPCILAGSAEGDTILDPFAGAGTTGLVALRKNRSFIGIELNPTYAEMARNRIRDDAPLLNTYAEAAA